MSAEPPPEQPPTTQLPAADKTDIRITELRIAFLKAIGKLDADVAVAFRDFNARVDGIERDLGEVLVWKGQSELRMHNNSLRAGATSSAELEQDQKLAMALVQLAEEKARGDKLEAKMITKEDLDSVTAGQTSAIVEGVKLAAKNPTVQKLLWALAGLALVAINAATNYVIAKSRVDDQTQGGHP